MKTRLLYIGTCCNLLLSVAASSAPQAPDNQNYIKTRTYCTQNGQTYYDDIQYYDGLGKPYMSINVRATPTNKDYILLVEYDDLGRKSREWLPVPLATANGYAAPENVKASAIDAEGYNDEMPYVSYVYEDTPDARVVEHRQPGASLQGSRPAAAKAYYLNDSSDSLSCWKLQVQATTRDTAVLNYGLAAPMTLFVTQTYNADGEVAYEFRDARGLQVLTQQKIEPGVYADTYYVYDDSNNLRFVLPPEFSSKIVDDSVFPSADSLLARYAYIYKYDERNRCVAKQLPGVDWIYIGYDKTDKPVLMQDGELRRQNRWSITLYDAFGRPAISGLLTGANLSADTYKSRAVQAVFDPSATATYCYRTDCGIDLSELLITEVHYYDDYRHRSALPAYFGTLGYVSLSGYGTRFGSDTDAVASKGLETGCLYSMLPDGQILLGANYYYDDKNRIIQRRMQTMHGGLYSEDKAYNFTGNILSRRESCQPQPGATTDVLISSYTYDDRGRLLSETASLNGTAVAPYLCSYDDFGRLISTTQGAGSHAVTTTRQYNIRNWLTSQQNALFEMSLAYNTPQYTATMPSYTGNITEWTWKYGTVDAENTYAFSYDKLSRLTDTKQYVDGRASDLFVERNLTYDNNGNILTLNRTDAGEPFHAFSYGYTGNQLTTLSDGAADYAYTYDQNGNMTNDGMNGLEVSYNHLNLIEKLLRGDTIVAKYSYLSDGTKLSAVNADGDGLVYHGSLVYKKQGSGISLESAGFTGGRFVVSTGGPETYYHLTDHLGSVRVVVRADGEIVEHNDYYPFGLRWNSADRQMTDNRYCYNGKEDQSFAGIPYSDYGARMYDPCLGVWHVVDPSLELNYAETPYGYCSNNSVKFMDFAGFTKFLAITVGEEVKYRGQIIAKNNPSIEHYSINRGIGELITTLKNASLQDEDGIGFMAIWSHGRSNKILADDNSGAITTDDLAELKDAIDNGEIAFAKGAIIYLGGCNLGWTDEQGNGFAQRLADVTGVVVVAANDQVTPVDETGGSMIYSTGHPKYPRSNFWRYTRKKNGRYGLAEGKRINVMSLLNEAIEWTDQYQRFDSAPVSAGVRHFIRDIMDVNPNVKVYIK